MNDRLATPGTMRYIITVNRDRLENDPSNPRVVRVEDTWSGEVTEHVSVALHSARPQDCPIIKSGPARMDGATVWIECDLVEVPDD